MKFLTSNSSGKDIFGGIHTHFQEHIRLSPNHSFNILELNSERKYIDGGNKTIMRYDVNALSGQKYVTDILTTSTDFNEFIDKSEKIISQYQNALNAVDPDVVMIFGTSLPSYYLLEAVKREDRLSNVLHSYSGVLEKEIGGYPKKSQDILRQIGKKFTDEDVLNKIKYIFPSTICKKTVEEIHGVNIPDGNIIPNGVSSEFYNKLQKRNVPNDFSIGFVGRLSSVKNPDLFLGINAFLENPAVLKIVTDIYAGANKPIGQSLLKKMTSGEVFYFHPRPSSDLANFYKNEISINLIPSLFETFCNVATESLVAGTPVILSDRAGVRDIFEKYGLEDLIFSIDKPGSINASIDAAKDMNFTIPENISDAIYNELRWENIIKKYNDIAKEIASK